MKVIRSLVQFILYFIILTAPAFAQKAPPKGASKLPAESVFATTGPGGLIICGKLKAWEPGKMIGKNSEFFMPLKAELAALKQKPETKSTERKIKKIKNKIKTDKPLCQAGPPVATPVTSPTPEATPEITATPSTTPPANMFKTSDVPLTVDDINHLYRKAGLGVPPAEAMNYVNQPASALVGYFMTYIDEPEIEADAVSWLDENPAAPHFPVSSISATGINLYALRILAKSKNQFHERLALLSLHDRLATSVSAVSSDNSKLYLMLDHLNLIRNVGSREMNYRKLVEEIGEDAVMVRWLSLDQNKKTAPNENYARELMELFSLDSKNDAGEDNYTNLDIIQVARAFTGWNVLRIGTEWKVIFTPNNFDADEAKLLFEGTAYAGQVKTSRDVVNHIFNKHPNAPVSLAKFLAREYLREDVPTELIQSLAYIIKENNYNLRPVMATLLSSEEFYKAENKFSIAKTPVERFIHLLRLMDRAGMPYDFRNVRDNLASMGCVLTQTDSVFGCDKLEEIPDGQRLLNSANLVTALSNNNTLFTSSGFNYSKFFPAGVTAPTPDQLIDSMQNVFGFNVTINARAALRDYLNSAMTNQGTLVAEAWNPANTAMVRRKVAGLFRMFATMPQLHDLR